MLVFGRSKNLAIFNFETPFIFTSLAHTPKALPQQIKGRALLLVKDYYLQSYASVPVHRKRTLQMRSRMHDGSLNPIFLCCHTNLESLNLDSLNSLVRLTCKEEVKTN